MQKLMPGVWRCPYRTLTEKKCPFCGLNSEFNRLLNRNWEEHAFHPAGKIIFGLLTTELFARIILLTAFFNRFFRKRFDLHSKQIFLFDILLHISGGLALFGLMVYCYFFTW